jgi:hypothetical protein
MVCDAVLCCRKGRKKMKGIIAIYMKRKGKEKPTANHIKKKEKERNLYGRYISPTTHKPTARNRKSRRSP